MWKNDQLKNAVELLLWTYFNLSFGDGDSSNDIVLNRCIERAYFDATQQGAYNTRVTEEKKRASEDAKKLGSKELGNAINRLFSSERTDFDQWHRKTCNYIESDIYAGIDAFSYGNAQKWVNMTLKYVYTLYQLYHVFSSECKFCVKYKPLIDNYAHCFHIPVDSFMIEALWEEKEIDLPLKEKANRSKNYTTPSDHVKPWSTWSEQDYEEFQKSVCDHAKTVFGGKSQLDWEGPEWIKVAKDRKNRKDRKAGKIKAGITENSFDSD